MGGEEAIDSTAESDKDGHLDSWEEGPAFGVGEDKDPICEVPVEEWVLELKITSTRRGSYPGESRRSSNRARGGIHCGKEGGPRAEKTHDNGRRARYRKIHAGKVDD